MLLVFSHRRILFKNNSIYLLANIKLIFLVILFKVLFIENSEINYNSNKKDVSTIKNDKLIIKKPINFWKGFKFLNNNNNDLGTIKESFNNQNINGNSTCNFKK